MECCGHRLMKKEIREKVYAKCNGRCGYCGRALTYKQMQVDHVYPKCRGMNAVIRGTDDFVNLLPACARCNRWKSTYSLETFRSEIKAQIKRLNLYSAQYRMAKDFGLLAENDIEIRFYFEG